MDAISTTVGARRDARAKVEALRHMLTGRDYDRLLRKASCATHWQDAAAAATEAAQLANVVSALPPR